MNKEKMIEIGKMILNKIDCAEICESNYENTRENPFVSERVGMEQLLKMMEIDFEYEFDNDYKITAINICGYRITR